MPRPAAPRARLDSRLAPLLLAGLTLLVFGRAIGFDFVRYDDHTYFFQNPRFNPPTWSGIAHYWAHPFINNYMPLMATVWGVAAMAAYLPGEPTAAQRLNPYVFHAVNVLLHSLAALAAYAALRQMNEAVLARAGDARAADARGADDPRRRAIWAAAIGAAVFAVHPIQVDPVAWISAMNVPLSGAFVLTAAWLYLKFARAGDDRGDAPAAVRRRRLFFYVLATLAFAGALLSKPLAATTPIGLIAIDLWLLRRPWRRVALALGPWVALSVIAGTTARALQVSEHAALPPPPPAQRLVVAGDALMFYVRQVALPLRFTIDYGRTPARVLADGRGPAWALAAAGLVAGLWLARRRVPEAWVGLCAFGAGLLPSLGLIPFDFQNISTTADRFAYHAMFGVAVLLSVALVRPTGSTRRAAWAIAGVVVVLLAARSAAQVGVWRDSHTLFAHASRVNPASPLARNNLAGLLLDEGRADEALAHARAAADIDPDAYRPRMTLGRVHDALGQSAAAAEAYRAAVGIAPNVPQTYIFLAAALERQGRVGEAVEAYEAALAVTPDYPPARAGLERLGAAPATRHSASAPSPDP